MGCTVREKHVRPTRKTRSHKHEFDPCCLLDKASKSILESGLKPLGYHLGLNDLTQDRTPNPNSNGSFEDNGWGYCTEEQLEEILLKNLEFVYNEAVSKLVSMGYEEDVAFKAILRYGHCYGGMDVLTNILTNSLAYLNRTPGTNRDCNPEDSEPVFADLRQLEEYSLAGMVCLLQQVKPHLSKGDAMWCLLMSDLNVGRASAMDVPSNSSALNLSIPVQSNVETIGHNGISGMPPALCRFHGGWGFGSEFSVNGFFSYSTEMNSHKDIECPKRFNLSPSMKSLLKRNVAAFAAGFRANSKQPQAHTCESGLSVEAQLEKNEEPQHSKIRDGINSMLTKFHDLNLDENSDSVTEDQKDELIVGKLHQINDLEKQVKERKEWAQQKAMQAARKLSNDLTELKMLRMGKEETQRLKKGKQILEDSTMKRLSEMENALRKASSQVDEANANVRRLENDNAVMRAEMEASKLNAAETVTASLEVAKREKKILKKLLACEKQKNKLQDEIAGEKQKIKELANCTARVELDKKDYELKLRQEQKAKLQAEVQVEEERRSKEAAEGNAKRKLESLRLRTEIDHQRHKDDIQILEQELSRLKASAQMIDLNQQPNKVEGDTTTRMIHEADEKDVNYERECLICKKYEVSVVFLPCAHQVICANCNDSFGKKGRVTCPSCHLPIEQRVRIFGASS